MAVYNDNIIFSNLNFIDHCRQNTEYRYGYGKHYWLYFFVILVAVIISAGGYFGAKAYFFTVAIFHALAIIYMLYVSINKTAEGWSDLVSIILFLFTIGVGILLGLIIQGICILVLKKRK